MTAAIPVDISSFAYITGEHFYGGGCYLAHDKITHQQIGRVSYVEPSNRDRVLLLIGMNTAEAYQHRRVMTALLLALHADHPEHHVTTGPRTESGEGLYQHFFATQPHCPHVVFASNKEGDE
jgi:hypothetical protein